MGCSTGDRYMKVFFINTVCGVGSTGKIVTGLLDALKRDGGEGEIAYGVGEAACVKAGEAYKILSRRQYDIHNLLSRLTDREGCFSAVQTKALIAEIRKYDPDVIHLHNLHGHFLNYEVLFRYLSEAGKPVIWTLHDCWAMTGHCTYFAAAQCEQWKTECRNCSQLKQYPQSWFFGNVTGNYSAKKKRFTGIPNLTIVTPSRWLADIVRESFLKDYPVRVIHNGIDLSVFRPVESDFRRKYHCVDKFLLLGVAFDWGYRKGLEVFAQLAKRLDDRFRIALVGTNADIDRQLPPNIISIHRTRDQRELAQIYTDADLFVNPTREDNFPTVNIEALACGTPVLTFRTGGSPEIPDETCASVVDCGDVDALEREIRRIAAEQPFGRKACLKRAEAFAAEQRFGEYIKLYHTLAEKEQGDCNGTVLQ